MIVRMTHEQIRAVLDRALTWPTERQHDAAEIPSAIERQDQSPLRLGADDAAEIRRRLADPRPTVSMDEVFKRFRPGSLTR